MKLKNIKLKNLVEFPICLRTIKQDDPEFKQLVESIGVHGVIEPIVVLRHLDTTTFEKKYAVVSGYRRYKAAQVAETKRIPCAIIETTEFGALYFQLILSTLVKEVRPVQYSKALVRILNQDPTITMSLLCSMLTVTPKWVFKHLAMTNLHEDIGPLVDSGKINVCNASLLCKLPTEEQPHFVDRAIAMDGMHFSATVFCRYKELRNAKLSQ